MRENESRRARMKGLGERKGRQNEKMEETKRRDNVIERKRK